VGRQRGFATLGIQGNQSRKPPVDPSYPHQTLTDFNGRFDSTGRSFDGQPDVFGVLFGSAERFRPHANARLAIMVALDSDVPYFYWTFDDFADLKAERINQGFEGFVWKRNAILSYDVGASHLTFDAPEEWDEGSRHVSFGCTANGCYEHQFEDTIYSGVRADTQSHVVLTGRWTQTDYGQGVFILVLPIKKGEEIPEPLMEAVPLPSETQVATAVVR